MREEALVSAVARRDSSAMSRIIDQYSRLLWPIASAVLSNAGSEQDVEECVADAFIYLWENPDKFDPARGSLKTLLCILVRSRAIDRYRQLQRKQSLPLEEAVISCGETLQDALLQKQTRQALLEAVQRLEEPNREILIRRYYQDQKPRQIALALGLTVRQINNSLYRSKRQLREMLTERGEVR